MNVGGGTGGEGLGILSPLRGRLKFLAELPARKSISHTSTSEFRVFYLLPYTSTPKTLPSCTQSREIMGQSVSTSKSTGGAQCPVDHNSLKPASCPVDHNSLKTSSQTPAQCPVDHQNKSPSSSSTQKQLAECPVDHSSLNQMPTLSQQPSPNQTITLPTARTESSILRDGSTKWDYPSPQQFYNALVRKGWETPEEHIETMVEIHNFLNEQAWQEVLKWEKRATE